MWPQQGRNSPKISIIFVKSEIGLIHGTKRKRSKNIFMAFSCQLKAIITAISVQSQPGPQERPFCVCLVLLWHTHDELSRQGPLAPSMMAVLFRPVEGRTRRARRQQKRPDIYSIIASAPLIRSPCGWCLRVHRAPRYRAVGQSEMKRHWKIWRRRRRQRGREREAGRRAARCQRG